MKNHIIFDIGMNNGDDTAYYLHLGYRVVAVEANPLLVPAAERRFGREIASGSLTILNVGVTDRPGCFPFWVCDSHSEWSSFDRSIASRDGSAHHAVDVPCRTFRSILDEFGIPHFLKIDIEGNDVLCLDGLSSGEFPKYISVEASDIGLIGRLRDLGYTGFKCISQFHYLPLQRHPSREQRRYEAALRLSRSRRLIARALRRLGAGRWTARELNRLRCLGGWTFTPGCSGPFGEDLPGRWQTAEELADAYGRHLRLRDSGEPSVFWNEMGYSFWTDFHARRDD